MTLGKRIKKARERLRPKVTQADVGAHFGISEQAVSGWEREIDRPDLDKIAKLARLLKIPAAWLLAGTGDPPPPDAIEVELEELNASERAIVRATIQALRKERGKVA